MMMFIRKYFLLIFVFVMFIIFSLQLCSPLKNKVEILYNIQNDTIDESDRNESVERIRKDSESEVNGPEIRDNVKCQSLFSISESPHLIKFPKGYLLESTFIEKAGKNSVGTENMNPFHSLKNLYQNLVESVKTIKEKRDLLPRDLLTDDYVRLAKIFPPIANYNNSRNKRKEMIDSVREEERGGEEGGNEDIKDHETDDVYRRIPSRIKEDFLPFVPCSVKTYENNSEVFSCISQRLEEKDKKLWIHFMGDSKMRYLLQEFLNRTDDVFHYMVELKNETKPWTERKADLTHGFDDFIVTSPLQPRMRITFSFRQFVKQRVRQTFQIPAEYHEIDEIHQLRKWANYQEPSPDLLVVGYTSWTIMEHRVYGEGDARYTPEILEMLMEMHQEVVPLLEKISQKTRVLVLPQSRLRRNAPKLDRVPSVRGAYNNANTDWSESTFLYFLKLHRRLHRHSKSHMSEESELKTHLMGNNKQKGLQISAKSAGDNERNILSGNDSSQKKVFDKKIPLKLKSLIKNQDDQNLNNNSSVETLSKKANIELGRQERIDPISNNNFDKSKKSFTEDHIKSPDFPLPHQLPRESSSIFHDYLSPSKETPGLWWWDAIIPFNMATLLQCQEMFQKGLTEDFLYKDSGLRCRDATHAGRITLHDLGTMILNLLCNSVLHIPSNYCCT